MSSSEAFCIDCMKFMSTQSDKFATLGAVDPEYGIGESSKNHASRNTPIKQKNGITLKAPSTKYKKKFWDSKPPADEYFKELQRVSVFQLIFGANYFKYIVGTPFNPPRRKDFTSFLKEHPTGWIIWDKVNGTSDFNDCELIYTTFDFESFVLPYMWAGMMQGRSISEGTTMQGNKKLNEKRIHPTQKPILIYKYLFNKFLVPGNNIYDSHLGSGSSRIAAHDLNLDFVGNEIDPEIFNDQERRFSRHTAQGVIF